MTIAWIITSFACFLYGMYYYSMSIDYLLSSNWKLSWSLAHACIMILMGYLQLAVHHVYSTQKQPSCAHKFDWIFVIKTFAIILPSQPLLGCHLRFHNLFMLSFFAWAAPFFTAWLFLCRFLFFLDSCTPSGHFVWALTTPQSYAISNTENSSGVKAPCLTLQTLTSHSHFLLLILVRGNDWFMWRLARSFPII